MKKLFHAHLEAFVDGTRKMASPFLGLLAVAVMVILLCTSCTSVTLPFDVAVPQLPAMDEAFRSDKLIMEPQSAEDLLNNLLIYEGQLSYWHTRSDALEDYIKGLAELSSPV